MRAAAGAIVAAAVIAAAIFVAATGTAAAAPREPLSASTSLAPRPAFFGERVTARAEIVVDKSVVDPGSVRFTPSFAPYAAIGQPQRSRADAGSVATLGFVYTLSCLDDGCLPGKSIRAIELPAANVDAKGHDGATHALPVRWPALLVAPRVTSTAAANGQPLWRIQLGLPSVSYRLRPPTAFAWIVVVAALCACAAAALLAWEIVRHRRIRQARARALSELAQAIQLVRESEERAGDDRRRALALLSRVLAAHANGGAELERDATRLAWDRPEPTPSRIEALLDDVEERLVRR